MSARRSGVDGYALPLDRRYLRPDLYMPPTQWAWDA